MARFPRIGEQFAGYTVLRQVGQGGMGVVFAAQARGLDRTVALKVLLPEFAQEAQYRGRFVREAAALATLDSPHIIHIYDHGERQGCLFLVTQFIPGGDLAGRLAERGGLPPERALELVSQVASAAADAHAVGVVHRDIKPSNVLLRWDIDQNLFAYLCDFGIAQTIGQPRTRTSGVMGSLEYIAPERFAGEDASIRSDVYSTGCLLWATLVGSAPFRGSDLAVMRGHLDAAVPQLTDRRIASNHVNKILRRAMAKAPADRYQSMSELRADLDRARFLITEGLSAPAGADEGRSVHRGSGSRSPERSRLRHGSATGPRSRRRVFSSIGLLTVAVLAVGTALSADSASPQPGSPAPSTTPAASVRTPTGSSRDRLPDNTLLVTNRSKGGTSTLYAVNVTSGKFHRVSLFSRGLTMNVARLPTISPDRASFIYLQGPTSGVFEEPRVRTWSGTDQALFGPDSPCTLGDRPAFSPDGQSLAIVCFSKELRLAGLYVVGLDGSQQDQVLVDGTPQTGPTWAYGGRIVFVRLQDGLDKLWSVLPEHPVASLAPVTTGPGWDFCPDWSAKHGLVFMRTEPSGKSDVWVMPRFQEQPDQLYQLTNVGNAHCPTWSPDGERIAFLRIHGSAHHSVLVTMNWDGSDRRIVGAPKDSVSFGPPAWGSR